MKNMSDAEADKFMRQFRWLLAGCVVLLLVPVLLYAVYLNSRFDTLQKSLRYRAPEQTGEGGDTDELEQVRLNPVQGQTVYVPAYSHVYHQDGQPHLLTTTLSVRNTSLNREIVVTSVRYYDTDGKEVKSHLKQPVRLKALATTEFLVERDDATGGSGANFIVEWAANEPVSEPVIEAVMIDTSSQQGISFVRPGKVIAELTPEAAGAVEEIEKAAGAIEGD